MIVVEFQLIFRNTKVLWNIHPGFYIQYRCSCRNQPNEDDLEEVIVVEFQVIFRNTKVLWNIHPCCNTHYRCPCRKQPNEDDSEEVHCCRISSDFS